MSPFPVVVVVLAIVESHEKEAISGLNMARPLTAVKPSHPGEVVLQAVKSQAGIIWSCPAGYCEL
jgi:hypothetical protein